MTRNNKSQSTNQRNTLGMDNLVYKQLLKKINQSNQGSPNTESPLRSHTRLEYHQPYLVIEMETSDRTRREITVATRNISRSGLSVLHSSYAYPGTVVHATLNRINGKPHTISGKIVRCEHLGGVVHEVGINFDSQIIVQEFIRPDIIDCVRTHERIDPAELKGKVLFVGTDKLIIPLAREYLQQTSIQFGFVESAKDAFEKKIDEQDIICVCLDAGDMTGPEFTRALRTKGFQKPVLLAGTCSDESTKNQIRLSTADGLITTPLTEQDFLRAFAEFFFTMWDPQILHAIRMYNCVQTSGTLKSELAKLGIVLDQHIRTQDAVQIFATCNKIKSIAPMLGLNSLRDKATEIGEIIANTGDTAPHHEALIQIKAMCTDRANAA